jgi:hypothetical protein
VEDKKIEWLKLCTQLHRGGKAATRPKGEHNLLKIVKHCLHFNIVLFYTWRLQII